MTNIPYGADQAVTQQSMALFAACMSRTSTLGRLTGKFPNQSKAEAYLEMQSSPDMPIVRSMNLSKNAGDEITFDIVNPINGKPIMGRDYAEGRGEDMTFDQDSLRVNQARKPVSAGDVMSQNRTPHQLRKLALSQARGYMNRFEDQKSFVHLAGSRGFHTDVNWIVPLAADADFTSIMVNTVRAPSYNRHFMSTGSSIEHIQASGNEITLESTDTMVIEVLDAIQAYLSEMTIPPPPVILPGDEMAQDDPIHILMVSAQQYNNILQSTNFRNFQANAIARASVAGGHALFRGDAGLWNNLLIKKMPKPIRFYSGDAVTWCASATATTETTTDLVPSAFSTSFAIDRAILLGGQALGEAYGKHHKSGFPYFWSEKELDHGDKVEVLVGSISGKSKFRFLIDHGDQSEYTDYGVMCIDSVVPRIN